MRHFWVGALKGWTQHCSCDPRWHLEPSTPTAPPPTRLSKLEIHHELKTRVGSLTALPFQG